jgi:hypothetical protein
VHREDWEAKGFAGVIRVYRKAPFYCGVVRTNSDNLHLVEEGQRIGANPRLWPVPLAVQQINAAVIARLIPHLTPARAHEQNIALLNLSLLGFGSVLEVFKGDPIIRREWVLALVFGHIK